MGALKDKTSKSQVANEQRFILNVDNNTHKLLDWVNVNREEINERVEQKGAVLIRGLKVMSSRNFAQLLTRMFDKDLLVYSFRSTPRTELRGKIYTATEYHSSETIPQHNENSYTNKWAERVGFFCMLPAQKGGATPFADGAEVYQRIAPEIREHFERLGVTYVRNYGELDLPWTEVFQTEDKTIVENYCKDNEIEFEWLANNGLRTKQHRPATLVHPKHGYKIWFNQAHLFHYSNLKKEFQESLLAVTTEENLPRNATFGDGSSIPVDYLDHIRSVYEELQIVIKWQAQDILLLDNERFSHGRTPFSGERKVLVGMT